MEIVDILLSASFWAAAIRIASPLIFATLGELICERAGILNLGIEGIMVAGAFAGWMAVYSGLGLWPGVAVAMVVGMGFGAVHSLLTVPFGLSQHVVGLGVTLLATSSTYYAYRLALPEVTSPPKITAFEPFAIPLLSDIPLLGAALFSQTPLTYLAFLLVGVVAFILYRTPLGLALRAAGESPAAVAAQAARVAAQAGWATAQVAREPQDRATLVVPLTARTAPVLAEAEPEPPDRTTCPPAPPVAAVTACKARSRGQPCFTPEAGPVRAGLAAVTLCRRPAGPEEAAMAGHPAGMSPVFPARPTPAVAAVQAHIPAGRRTVATAGRAL